MRDLYHPQRGAGYLSPEFRQACALRTSADRFEIRGEVVTALLFRNAAWRIEHGHEWLDDINIREVSS